MNSWNFLTQPNLIQPSIPKFYILWKSWRKMNIDILPSRSCPVFLHFFSSSSYEEQGWDLEYWVWLWKHPGLCRAVGFHEMRVFHVWKDILLPCTKASAWRNGMAPVMMSPVLSGRENWDSICIDMAWHWAKPQLLCTEYRVTPRKGYTGFLETSNTRLNSIFDHDSGWEGNEFSNAAHFHPCIRNPPYKVCTSYTHDSKFRRLPFLVLLYFLRLVLIIRQT